MVVSAVPFHRISAPEEKPIPLAVIVNPWLPATAELGLMKAKAEEAV